MINSKIGDYKKLLSYGEDVLTKFLDLEEQKELVASLGRNYQIKLFGGYEASERCRAYISNDYQEEMDFEIVILESHYDPKYSLITHRHVLGTIMGLGVNRNILGDILIDNNKITIFVIKEMKEYIINNLDIILHQRMNWQEINSLDVNETNDTEKVLNVASMRLDAIVSKGCNKSRNEANELIEHGMVLINHKEVLNNSYLVKVNDIISVRKFGRIEIVDVLGTSKKERINLKVIIRH